MKEVSVVVPLLKDLPDIIVCTPGCFSQHLNLATSLAMLIDDEADLIFSFCFESDLRQILNLTTPHLPGTTFDFANILNSQSQILGSPHLYHPV